MEKAAYRIVRRVRRSAISSHRCNHNSLYWHFLKHLLIRAYSTRRHSAQICCRHHLASSSDAQQGCRPRRPRPEQLHADHNDLLVMSKAGKGREKSLSTGFPHPFVLRTFVWAAPGSHGSRGRESLQTAEAYAPRVFDLHSSGSGRTNSSFFFSSPDDFALPLRLVRTMSMLWSFTSEGCTHALCRLWRCASKGSVRVRGPRVRCSARTVQRAREWNKKN